MSGLPRNEIQKGLKIKGFFEVQRGKRHIFYYLVVNHKKTGIKTWVSRGSGYRIISDDLLKKMATQLKLQLHQFRNLIECPLDYNAYLQLLRENKYLRH